MTFLSSHCILCQRFVPRTQEFTSHFHHRHSDLADRAVQAGRDFIEDRTTFVLLLSISNSLLSIIMGIELESRATP